MFYSKFRFYLAAFISALLLVSVQLGGRVYAAETDGLPRVSMQLTYDGQTHDYENYKLTLYIDGAEITELLMPPVLIDSKTYVPAGDIFTRLGAVVDWKDAQKQLFIGYGDRLIVMQIGSNIVQNNGVVLITEHPPMIVNDKTMVPITLAEQLGFGVTWADETKSVHISSKPSVPAEATQTPETAPSPTPSAASAETPAQTEPALPGSSWSGSNTFSPPNTTPAADVSVPAAYVDYPAASVTDVVKNSGDSYTIRASSEISGVQTMVVEDNRFVVDIMNASMDVNGNNLNFPEDHYISSVRVGQNQVEPVMIARVVFDLKHGLEVKAELSADRKSVEFSFAKNEITSVALSSDGVSDYITVTGKNAPVISLFTLPEPDRLVIDMPMALIAAVSEQAGTGRFVSGLRYSQFDGDTARIAADLNAGVSLAVSFSGNTTVIKLSEPTYRNVSYDSELNTLTIVKNPAMPFNAGDIVQQDQYLDLRYSMTLPISLFDHVGYGHILVGDNYLNGIEIIEAPTGTQFIFSENRILAYRITEDEQNIYVQAMLPKEAYDFVVVLDAGHGADDPGAIGHGLYEKDLTLDIVKRMALLAETDGGVKLYLTRTGDTYPTLMGRAEMANEIADVFMSVHINSFTTAVPTGQEVFYNEHPNDASLGFSCEAFAEIALGHLNGALNGINRGIKPKELVVLNETDIPAVLCEVEFVSSPEGAARLATESYRQTAAGALYTALLQVSSDYKPLR